MAVRIGVENTYIFCRSNETSLINYSPKNADYLMAAVLFRIATKKIMFCNIL